MTSHCDVVNYYDCLSESEQCSLGMVLTFFFAKALSLKLSKHSHSCSFGSFTKLVDVSSRSHHCYGTLMRIETLECSHSWFFPGRVH